MTVGSSKRESRRRVVAGDAPRPAPGPARRIARALLWGLLCFVLLTWLPVLALRWYNPPVTAFMLLHNPLPLAQTRTTWRDADALGDYAALAAMAAEDQRFPDHHGVDLAAIVEAVDEHQQDGGRLRGGSGITQQLAKNLFLWPGRSLLRKSLEAYLATVIDLLLSKRRILELYLNVVELGPGVYGVPAAAQAYFGIDAAQLTAAQAALLAAVLPNPTRMSVVQPSDYVRGRQRWIEEQAMRLRERGWLEAVRW